MCFAESRTTCASLTVFRSAGFGSYSWGSMPGFTCAVTATRSPPTCCAISVRIVEKLETRTFASAKTENGKASKAGRRRR